MLNQGTFLLSIDTELAWGAVHNGSVQSRLGYYRRTREAIRRLLALQEQYEIRATWAVVGHLFLEQCRAENGVKHPEVTRPSYSWFHGDWFDADPCTDLEADPFWYGPDIVEQILACKVPQEIGSHGFSHMITGDPGCSRDCFDSEVRACLEQAQRWGLALKSFVFPRNSVGHLDVLAEHQFTTYRGNAPAWYSNLPAALRRVVGLVDRLLPVPPPVTSPRWADGIWDLSASYFYPHRDGWARLVPVGLSVRKAYWGLEKAAQRHSIFHLWFHPFNLASDVDGLLGGLETIFQRVCQLRESGRLANPTMGDLAESLQLSAPETRHSV